MTFPQRQREGETHTWHAVAVLCVGIAVAAATPTKRADPTTPTVTA